MNGSEWNDKIDDVKVLLGDISKDITDVLTTAQLTVPLAQGMIEKIRLRMDQVDKLFSKREVNL